jgi:hypothetical protein
MPPELRVELEVGLDVAPAIRMKGAIYILAIVVDLIDAGKALGDGERQDVFRGSS